MSLPFFSPSRPLLAKGDGIPDVKTLDDTGTPVAIRDLARDGSLVVFFYPMSGTPGCTRQACSLRDAFDDMAGLGLAVVVVCRDAPAALARFRERRQLPFPLLSDPDGLVAAAFGVGTIFGVLRRSAFLFHQGTLVWSDLKASTVHQSRDILAAMAEHLAAAP